ncbi:MAG: MBL fold metallo-hydrolase [Lentisphaerae bacterium]|nr:MBL fold metallo-hydrolase [Lentisphaerota bacterium]
MEICVLNSGSNGNAIFIASGSTGILIDAGLSARVLRARLGRIGRELRDLSAILVTHEHVDHCRGLPGLAKACPAIQLYANESTAAGVEFNVKAPLPVPWSIFETGSGFTVGSLHVQSFAVPHDTGDPVAYVVDDGSRRIGVATDLGTVTPVVERHLRDCDVLVLETNHDVDMLRQSGRPWSLIQRILGRQGHLSNEQAAELVGTVLSGRLRAIFPAHLSEDCNTPECALFALRAILQKKGCAGIALLPTHRDGISEHLVF